MYSEGQKYLCSCNMEIEKIRDKSIRTIIIESVNLMNEFIYCDNFC